MKVHQIMKRFWDRCGTTMFNSGSNSLIPNYIHQDYKNHYNSQTTKNSRIVFLIFKQLNFIF